MLGREAHARSRGRAGVALAEAGVVDEPGRARLPRAVGLLPAGRVVGQRRRLGGGQDRVGEERARAPGVVVVGVEHHALAAPQRQDGGPHVGQGRSLTLGHPERAGQLGVPDGCSQAPLTELEGDLEDHVTARVGLEPAGAVAEVALGGGEGAYGAPDAVPDADPGDGLGDLLAVGADVLDRRGADRAGDAGERLQPHPAAADRLGHQVVPSLARRDRDRRARAGGVAGVVDVGVDAAGGDLDDRAVEALVGDDEVGAPAEHEHGLTGLVGTLHRREQLLLGGGAHPVPPRSAQAQGGVVAEVRHGPRPPGTPAAEPPPWASRGPSAPRR